MMHPDFKHRLENLLKLLGVAALYALLAKIVLVFFSTNGMVSSIWPSSGLALAAILIGGKRYAWSVFLGSLAASATTDIPFGATTVISIGRTLGPLFGIWLLTRDNRFNPNLGSLRDYLRLVVLAGGVSSSISALIGSTALLASGSIATENYFLNLIHWWMGNALGIVLIAPVILVWRRIPDGWQRSKQMPEAMLLLGLAFLVNQVIFLDWFHGTVGLVAKGYWMFLFVTWAAVRLGTHGVLIILLMTAIQALLGGHHGTGFFADDLAKTQLTNYWFYMVTLSLVGMTLASYFAEHKRDEQALRIAATVFETHEGIMITDSNKAILRINRAFTRIYGYSSEEVIGAIPSILQSGQQDDEFYRAMWEKLLRDKYWAGEIWDKRKNGEVFPAWLTVSVVTAEDGSITHYIGTFTDITEYKHTQEELQRHRDHLQDLVDERTVNLHDSVARINAILDTVVDGIITINEHGIVETVNPAAEYIFGYAAAEVVGHNISMLMPEPYHSEHDGYLERYLATGEARVIGIGRIVEGRRKDGSTFPLDLAVSTMQLGEGRFFTGIVRDITERKRFEQALVVAKTEAEQANRAKSDFLSTMSHEIRTPMNGVIGMVDVLHQTSLKGYQVEMVDTIRDSAFSLLGIIEDILDFSKIEAGKLEIESVPTAVSEVIEKVCVMLDHLATKKQVELTLFTDPAIPAVVLSDAQRLRQIVVNLANNAIKFSSGQRYLGRVSVLVVLVKQDAKQACLDPSATLRTKGLSRKIVVEIRVIDNGIGMDQDTQARLFTPFTQADVSTTRRFGGTGLGLTIARNLVQLMGGEMTVQSMINQGSIFIARLPFTPVSDEVDDNAAQSLVAGLCCLIVGGTEGMADHLAAYLLSADAVVVQVPNLAAARKQTDTSISSPWIWVLDSANMPPLPETLSTIIGDRGQDIRFVVIGRGVRRRPRRKEGEQVVTVDGNVLTRQTFLKTVAIAAGRELVEVDMPPSGKGESAFIAPLRIDALRQDRLILVAEDNETNQKVILQQLALLGLAADVANDGHEALERWRSGDYALLLTDLHMPKMDGYELASAIRTEENDAQHFVIIALTANTLKGEALRCLNAGMDDYLSKPAPLENLKAMLNKWLPDADLSQSIDTAILADTAVVPKPVDVSVLSALVGDSPEVINDFLRDFRRSATQIAAELKAAFEAGQAVQAGALAHKLKSSARAVGALALGELCEEIEQAGKAGRIEGLAVLLPRFEAEMTAVNEYLDSL